MVGRIVHCLESLLFFVVQELLLLKEEPAGISLQTSPLSASVVDISSRRTHEFTPLDETYRTLSKMLLGDHFDNLGLFNIGCLQTLSSLALAR